MKNYVIVLFFLCIVNSNAWSQKKSKFIYNTDVCSCEGYFDSTKYTRKQLENVRDYLIGSNYIWTNATAWDINEVRSLSVEKLKKECEESLNTFRTLDIVNNQFWKKALEDNIKLIEGTCKLKEITILAYENPDTLMSYENTDSTTEYYRDALIKGGDEILTAWKDLIQIQKKKNGNPENLQQKFEKRYNSQDRLKYAQLEIMMFGWWNNSNHLLPHIVYDGTHEKEFEKLFTKVKCGDCYEP